MGLILWNSYSVIVFQFGGFQQNETLGTAESPAQSPEGKTETTFDLGGRKVSRRVEADSVSQEKSGYEKTRLKLHKLRHSSITNLH